MNGRPRARHRRGVRLAEHGFTLVELLLSLVLATIIGGVVVAALITSLNASDSTTDQVSDSTDAGLISAYLIRDAQSAGGIDPASARLDPTLGVSTDPADTGSADCLNLGRTVTDPPAPPVTVRFSWIDRISATTKQTKTVVYAVDGQKQLMRRECEGGTHVDAVLGSSIERAVASCVPSAEPCAGQPRSVELHVWGSGTRAPFDYILTASLRTATSQLAIVSPLSLPAASLNAPYSTTLTTIGAVGWTKWSWTNLPDWLHVGPNDPNDPSDLSGVVWGTPLDETPAAFTVTVTDSTGAKASMDYTLEVGDAGLGIFLGHQDLGGTGRPGDSRYVDPTYTVQAGKGDIGSAGDAFQYVYRPLTGDGRLTVRVASQTTNDQGSQAGVMFRETLDPASSFAMVDITDSNGGQFVYRNGSGTDAVLSPDGSGPAPYWLRLTRVGNVFTAERSVDGATWTGLQQVQIPMAQTIYVGLAVTAHNNSVKLSTATFDNAVIATPPTVSTTAGSLGYVENGATAVDPGITIVDADSANLESATVAITSGYVNGQDALAFSNQSGITGTWSAATGVLSLTGSASLTTYQAALASVTYANNSDDPNTAVRNVNFSVNDGIFASNTAVRAITVTSVDDAPVLAASTGSVSYVENGTSIVDPGITIADVDNANLVSAAVAITSGYASGQDTLAFTNQSGITGSWSPSNGVLSLTGSASLANYRTALRSITYSNGSDNPTSSNRTVSFVANDGTVDSNTATRTITVTSVDDAPTLVASNGPLAYIENGNPTVDSLLSVNDIDNTNLVSATVAIASGYISGQDTLGFTNQNGITGSWSASTGVLSLSGTASVADYRLALHSITYSNSSNNPNTSDRVVTFVVSDGSLSSNTVTRQITVTAVNDAPVVITAGTTLGYTENGVTSVDTGVTVSDVDNASLTSASVWIFSGYVSAEDTLAFTNQNGIVGTWSAGTGVLTLSGTSTIANYQAALRSVNYVDTSHNPSTATRIVAFSVDDGALDSATATRSIAVTAVNDAPVNNVPGPQVTPRSTAEVFSSANGSLISISDVDAGNASVQVQLIGTNGLFTLSGTAGLTFTAGDGTGDATMTFTGAMASINQALAGLTFNPTANFTGLASLQIVTSDRGNTGTGGTLTDTETIQITVDNAPVVTATATSLAYAENAGAKAVDTALTLADSDSSNMTSASVAITANYVIGQDALAFTNANGITGSWNATTGVLSLSGSATRSNYQTALRAVTYTNSSDTPSTAIRTVALVVNDGLLDSNAASRTITITATNDVPVVTPTGGSMAYTENGTTAVDPTITVSDVDSTNIASANVTITTNRVAAQDVLAFSPQNGITATFTPSTGVLALTGSSSVANYQAALRSITYTNSSDNPTTTTRTVTFVVNDGTGSSLTASRTITLTAVNDAPVNNVPGGQSTAKNVTRVFSSANGNLISISDVDAGTGVVQVQLTASHGTITLSSASGLTFSVGDGTSDATMTFTGTITTINSRLAGLSFIPTSGYTGAASLQITTNDQGLTGGGNLSDSEMIAITVV